MFNYSFEFYFAKNSFNILWKKIYPNFISQKNTQIIYWFYNITFYVKHFINRNTSYEIFNFRIKIIFRDKILYQFNKFNQGPIIELFPVHFNFLLIDRQVQFFRFF